jgi:hypothetical protein
VQCHRLQTKRTKCQSERHELRVQAQRAQRERQEAVDVRSELIAAVAAANARTQSERAHVSALAAQNAALQRQRDEHTQEHIQKLQVSIRITDNCMAGC